MIISQRIWNIARLLYWNVKRGKYKQKHAELKINFNILWLLQLLHRERLIKKKTDDLKMNNTCKSSVGEQCT